MNGDNARSEPILIGEKTDNIDFDIHRYDVDIISSFYNIEKILNSGDSDLGDEYKDPLKRKEYLDVLKHGIATYCKPRNINFDYHFKNRVGLVVPSLEDYYIPCLALSLICCDVFRIRLLLQYQQERYEGSHYFLDVIENLVCDIIKNKNFVIDKNERLERIIEWVEEEKFEDYEEYVAYEEYEQPGESDFNEHEIDNDHRIDCKATEDQIRGYFLKLTQKNKKGQQMMDEEDINHLLQANFRKFKPIVNIKKFTPNMNQNTLRYFVYQFYWKYSRSVHELEVYANFLKKNFTLFKNAEIVTIKSNLNKRPSSFPSSLDIN